MQKLLLLSAACLMLAACGNFHTKQPVDDTYYKKTQGVAWPDSSSSADSSSNKAGNGSNGASTYGASGTGGPELNWQDPTAVEKRQVPIPEMPDKKLQCVKTDRNSYTCRLGQYQCGKGCKSDGSNCYYGYCLQSECDDIMGQKWDLVYQRNDNLYACQHPTAKVSCRPDGGLGTKCWDANKNANVV